MKTAPNRTVFCMCNEIAAIARPQSQAPWIGRWSSTCLMVSKRCGRTAGARTRAGVAGKGERTADSHLFDFIEAVAIEAATVRSLRRIVRRVCVGPEQRDRRASRTAVHSRRPHDIFDFPVPLLPSGPVSLAFRPAHPRQSLARTGELLPRLQRRAVGLPHAPGAAGSSAPNLSDRC